MNNNWMQLIGSALSSGADIYSSTKTWQTAQLGYESQAELVELEREKIAAQAKTATLIVATIVIVVLVVLIAVRKK